ncbi:peptidylprolyl isomerase [Roseovarius sp. LXJ103]|uniref:peptidylprolyl isomerase n=1 Tax=Roseovarius carneus TaxID=2853164 RepID=UPI000D60B011|nr:peptidylprolyl isomerase [Roseovarius carneus]MBZ8117875.1 peptidylprolyl isomerase [Roseovarius carneus]PWE36365.1 peptidylprolyl isomerase [Pelagicola sp. LXJ1103]
MIPQLSHLPLCAAMIGALALPATAQDDVTADTVVATVNTTEITLGHMIVLRAGLPDQFAQLPADVLYTGILDQLVQQTLMMDAHGEDLSKVSQLMLENERRAVTASEEINRITTTAVNDAAIEAYFQANYVNGDDVTEYSASHILVETEEKAQELVGLLDGGADFAALAQEHSTGPSGPNGGQLGWFGPGMMVEEFQEAVEQMEVGSVSPPVQTQFGWHLILLSETRAAERPELNDVRGEIEEALRVAAVEEAVLALTEMGDVDRAAGDALSPSVLDRFDLLAD